MEYGKLVAVTGLPGLYELISSKSDGGIVRSLDDKSTRFVSTRIHQFSHLESIEVYTLRENVNLIDVFLAMDKSTTTLPDEKDARAIQKYFDQVFPEMDHDRVYDSDRKKMIKWFALLKKHAIPLVLTESNESESDATA
jgi:Domain of unknown function (DUF5606)